MKKLKHLLSKKKLLVAVPVLVLALSAGVYALPTDTPKPEASIVAEIAQEQDESEPVTFEGQEQPVAQTPQNQPEPTQPAPEPEPKPAFGEDPNHPGNYVVFDKISVMDAAGIAPADQAIVSYLAQAINGWVYKGKNIEVTLCGTVITTSGVPAVQGWPDDPAKQLQWCDSYVVNYRYGSWEKAKEYFDANGHL